MNSAEIINALSDTAVVTIKFNNVLRKDPDGIVSIYDGARFNTPDAEIITQGSTYQRSSLTFLVPAKDGLEIAVIGIGRTTACYVENKKTVYPGDNVIWLIADQEFYYNGV